MFSVQHEPTKSDFVGPQNKSHTFYASDGFACKNCGLRYGEPIYHKTSGNEISEEIKFLLDLEKLSVYRKINITDIRNANHTPVAKIPDELAQLEAGTVVWKISGKIGDRYYTIVLQDVFGSPQYIVANDCFI